MVARRVPVSRLEPVSFYKGLETRDFIQGESLQRRAEELGALCLRSDAEDILEQRDEIPASWQWWMFLFPHGDPKGPRRRSTFTFLFHTPDGGWKLGEDHLATFCVRWASLTRCLRERTIDAS